MTNVPRRLPPTQGQRIRNVTTTHASLSGQGRTAAARPVPQSRPTPQIYRPSSGQNVVTGPGSTSGTSITFTTAGSGSSDAAGDYAIAIGDAASAAGHQGVAIGSSASCDGAEAAAYGDFTNASGESSVAIGDSAESDGVQSISIGSGAITRNDYSMSLGSGTSALFAGSVAIGRDHAGVSAHAHADDEFVLGTNLHNVIIRGGLILADESGGLWRVTVSGGALSVVAYP